jgi:hypothetical protein
VTRVVCEHGYVAYIADESVFSEMGFEHVMVRIEFACTQCDVSVLVDQHIKTD